MKPGDKYIDVTFVICAEDGQYSALCEELGTVTCGDTVEEALANLKEAVEVDLDTLEELGERPRFFRKRGIKIRSYRRLKVNKRVNLKAYRSSLVSRERMPLSL